MRGIGRVGAVGSLGGVVLAMALSAPAAAQEQRPLALDEALRRAETAAFANRISAGRVEESGAAATGALKGILPTVRVEAGFVRTTDPIGAFGTALRQRRIGAADFDPARLNHPGAMDNWVGAVVVEQPLLNADAHLGRRAAGLASDAAAEDAEWTRVRTRVDVIRAYYGAVLAAEQVATLEAADRAARAHVAQAESLVRQGLATKSDALLASVKAGEVEAELIEARGAARLAVRQLAVLLGNAADTTLIVPTVLPPASAIRTLLEIDLPDGGVELRSDVGAARFGHDAARADQWRARSLHLPRLNGFARYDWNSELRPYGGEENWTVGVMATWTPFAGATALAERQATGGRADAAEAGLAAARAQATLEIEQAGNARIVALARLEIAERGALQSAEAHRIVARKYEGGMATVIELLDAAAVQTASELGLSHARYRGVVADAERRAAQGLDPAAIAGLLDEQQTLGWTR